MNLRDIIIDEINKVKVDPKWIKLKKDKESPRKRRDDLFDGHDELTQLAHGIYQENEEDECELEEEKEKTPGCTSGNPHHDKKGRFVDPNKEGGSWSLANKSQKSGCQRGKARRPSGRKQLFQSIPCGRVDVDDPNVKAKQKCKDKKNKKIKEHRGWQESYKLFVESVEGHHVIGEEEEFKASEEHVVVPSSSYEFSKEKQELESAIKRLKQKLELAKKDGGGDCPLSYNDALTIVRNLKISQKGSTADQEAAKANKTE